MRWSKWLGAVVGLVLSVVVGATSARADEPAALDSVAIQGETVVGGTLTAVVAAHGDPAPTIEYQCCAAMRAGSLASASRVRA